MKLIDSIPFILPSQKRGTFQENFASTGAPSYVITNGVKVSLPTGISLSSNTTSSCELAVPTTFSSKDFEAEVLVRSLNNTTSDLRVLVFRFLNASNRIFIRITTAGAITLVKTVAGVATTVATGTKTCVQGKFNKIGVRAYGANIEVFLNGARIINAQETAQKDNNKFLLQAVGTGASTARAEWSYLSIRAL